MEPESFSTILSITFTAICKEEKVIHDMCKTWRIVIIQTLFEFMLVTIPKIPTHALYNVLISFPITAQQYKSKTQLRIYFLKCHPWDHPHAFKYPGLWRGFAFGAVFAILIYAAPLTATLAIFWCRTYACLISPSDIKSHASREWTALHLLQMPELWGQTAGLRANFNQCWKNTEICLHIGPLPNLFQN